MANLGPLKEIDAYCVGSAGAKKLPVWLWERIGIDVHLDNEGSPPIIVDGPEGRTTIKAGEFIFRLPDGTLGTILGLTPETVPAGGQVPIQPISRALAPKPVEG